MIRRAWALVALFALSGCAALEQHRAERAQARIMSAASQCEAIGFVRNSQEHLACTRELYSIATAQAQARSDAFVMQGLQILATPPPAPAAPVMCSTRWFAGRWVTTCP